MYRQPEPDDDTTPLPISWEDYQKKPAASSSSSSSSASKLPALFQNLTPRDWGHIRATAATQRAGDEEAVMTSVGYLDVGKLPGGLAYIGAMTFDANGGGGLSYRKVMQPQWGR